MFFPTAGIEIAPWVPPLVAFVISFFTSMGGVSGAFLLLPFQVSVLGYVNPSVSATNQLFNVVAIPSGVYRYCKEGRMLWPLTWIVVVGTLPGVFVGAFVRTLWLPDPRHFKMFAAAVLLYIGVKMVRDLLATRGAAPGKGGGLARMRGPKAAGPAPAVAVLGLTSRRLTYSFQGETHDVSCAGILVLSLVVGVVGGAYGIGGGSIIAPFLVTFFRLPVHTVAGAALMGTFVTSVAGVAFYQGLAPFFPHMSVAPDWALGLLFGIGGTAGMYLGARCQKYMPARAIKTMLAGVIVFTALKYVMEFFQ
ncbi:sulfite exporter TauE/SafE family protein [Desulfocurvus vexinensis]|uniref:sulfite exporter TauE/SafE family protein n=1 Tax=Desulfocurvus vexinensis TaxID=399548 RepID=UPI00048C2DEB|nr:sulfite exporter TauE/SafE family protein [Desulfocurvus vexinensis]